MAWMLEDAGMISLSQWLELFRYVHGGYNTIIFFALIYQGWIGLKIARQRRTHRERDLLLVSRHRINGPVLALLAFAGYVVGIMLVLSDYGRVFQFVYHGSTALAIIILIAMAVLSSRQIRGMESPWRIRHFGVGLMTLFLYVIQIFLGLDILF